LITKKDLSKDQKIIYSDVLKWFKDKNDLLLRVGGVAGSGKTSLLSLLAKKLGENIAFCCFTGKAANVLKIKLDQAKVDYSYCGTIHGLIYKPIINNKTLEVIGWTKKISIEESTIVIDEASMVGSKMWNDLTRFGLKILVVGDHFQLPPINSFINLMDNPDIKLEKIHRQAKDNPIIKLSMFIREGGDIKKFKSNDNRIAQLSKYDYDKIENFFKQMYVKRNPLESAVLSLFNNTRNKNNQMIRELCGRGKEPEEGDLVICLKNIHNKEYSIFNGMRGIINSSIKTSNNYEMEVDFPDEKIQLCDKVCKYQFNQPYTFGNILDFKKFGVTIKKWADVGLLLDYGYSLTVHKAQGSQFENVMVFIEKLKSTNDEYFRRWLYTAVTRSSINLALVH